MAAMPRDHLPEGEAKRAAVRSMFDAIAPRYGLVNRLLTFGLDDRWRRATVAALELDPGSTVLDLASGPGELCVELAERGHRPIGIDLSFGMLAAAVTDAPLVHGDLAAMPIATASVDGAVCGFALRNFVSLPDVLAELARVVRPGGRIGLLDVSQPDNPLVKAGHGFYFNRIVPLVGGILSDRSAYAYLPRSVSYLPPPAELVAMIADAGFDHVDRAQLTGGISQLLTATRRA